jgi:hypothetical protein
MRVLERAGCARADIARFLGVRYQQVRNTLEGDKRTGYNPEIVPLRDDEGHVDRIFGKKLREIKVDENGFGMIPPDLLDMLEANEPESLFALKVRGGLFICTEEGLVGRAEASF